MPESDVLPDQTHIVFIGAGNMAASIIGGLIAQGFSASNITACDPNAETLDRLKTQFSVRTNMNNLSACATADVIVLAVKPQVLKPVATALKTGLSHHPKTPLIVSIAAGISEQSLQAWLSVDQDKPISIVRCMPNTPALARQGATGLFANAHVSHTQKTLAEQLLGAVGVALWLDSEDLLDAVTAVSGSGPAYFFLLMEAMIDAGVQQGLSFEQAQQLTLQTAAGAATLAQQSDVPVNELRRRVTSPGGTTEQAVLSFQRAGLGDTVAEAMAACANRSKAMATEYS